MQLRRRGEGRADGREQLLLCRLHVGEPVQQLPIGGAVHRLLLNASELLQQSHR